MTDDKGNDRDNWKKWGSRWGTKNIFTTTKIEYEYKF